MCAPQPTRVCPVPAPHATVSFGGASANQRRPRRGGINGPGSFGEAMDSSFSPGHSSPHSFGGRHEWSPPMASFGATHQPSRPSDVGSASSSPPSIVGFNPPPAHAQSVVNVGGAIGGCRSDAGREILSILSARRQEQARSWLGMSPPDRAANPVSHDLRFQQRQREAESAYGGGVGVPTTRGGNYPGTAGWNR